MQVSIHCSISSKDKLWVEVLILPNVVGKEHSRAQSESSLEEVTEKGEQQSSMWATEKGTGGTGCNGVRMRHQTKKTLPDPSLLWDT